VTVSGNVTFTGFSASDADSDTMTYAWVCTNGGTFTNNAVANPQYIAPSTARTDTCTLIVSDGYEGTTSSAVTVTVNNAAVNGACGTAATSYAYNASAFSGTMCSAGSGVTTPASPAFPAQGGSTTWTCGGSNGGSSSGTCTATRALTTLDATVISSTIPTSMTAGQAQSVSVTMKNTGSTTWSEATSFRLGSVGDSAGVAYQFDHIGRFYLPAGTTVATNQQYTFTFNMTAPATAGTYIPQYRMVQDGVAWFGSTQSTTIIVSAAAAPSATNFKSPLDIANAIGSSEEVCWYCTHYRTTGNVIASALGGAAGNLQFKFDYQSSSGNMTGYEFAIGPTNDVNAATTIKSSDWVSATGASGTTVTVANVNGFPISAKISPSQSLSQLAYGTTYYWWVKVKNSTSESAWISAGTYAVASHHYPSVKVVYINSGVNNFQACTTVKSLTGTHSDDPCFSACWKGAGTTIDLNSANWVCSTCYNPTTNAPQLCITDSISWTLPSNKPTGFNFKTGSTSTTSNPIFTPLTNGQTVNLQVDIVGSTCPLEQGLSGSTTPLPKWQEK
jgi:hypothetical protein